MMQYFEGIVQPTVNTQSLLDERSILGNLREIAQKTLDADNLAVLLTDPTYKILRDVFKLGAPEAFLDVCEAQLQSMSLEERLTYLGSEVLLRERLPGLLPVAVRVREAEAAEAWSYMRLPLSLDDTLIGFVALFSTEPGLFDGAHLQLGRLFTAQVANAIRNVRLFYRLQQLEQRQRAINQVTRLIAEESNVDAVLVRIVEEAVRLVDGIAGLVLLKQPDDSLLVSAAYGATSELIGQRLSPGLGLGGMIATSATPNIITNYREWEYSVGSLRELVPDNGVVFGVPLVYRGRVLGVLEVLSGELAPEAMRERLDVLMMLAPQAAIAIAKAQLHETVRQERQQLLAILDHTTAVIVVCDADGRVLSLNPEAQRVLERLGLDPERVEGELVLDLIEQLAPDLFSQINEIGSVVEVNLGTVGQYLIHISPIIRPGGIIERFVAIAQDISQLRELDRMRSDLIQMLSHDLRNPLGLARGSIDLLDEPDLPPEQHKQLYDMIVSSLDRMEELINDVVDLQMATTVGTETAMPYDLPPLVRQVIKRNQQKAQLQHLTLRYVEERTPPHHLKGQAIMVGQAIDNLVSNALKYTPEGGQVTVTISTVDEYALVQVEDTGYGIPQDNLAFIFDQFYRVKDKRTRHIPGTGLGLSLVQAIAQAHGGYITVHSQVDVGSRFTLGLPLFYERQTASPNHLITRIDLSALGKRSQE